MVNFNQILLKLFPPPPNLFSVSERITYSCLPFRKTAYSLEKTTTFDNITVGYFPRQTHSFLKTLSKHEDSHPILTW